MIKKNKITVYIDKKPMFKIVPGENYIEVGSKNILESHYENEFLGIITKSIVDLAKQMEAYYARLHKD